MQSLACEDWKYRLLTCKRARVISLHIDIIGKGSCYYGRALSCQLYPLRRLALWCKRKCWQSWPTAATSPLFYGPFSPWNMTSWNRSNNLCHAAPHPSFTPTTYSSFALWLLILESFMEPLKLTPIVPNDGTFVKQQNLILRYCSGANRGRLVYIYHLTSWIILFSLYFHLNKLRSSLPFTYSGCEAGKSAYGLRYVSEMAKRAAFACLLQSRKKATYSNKAPQIIRGG